MATAIMYISALASIFREEIASGNFESDTYDVVKKALKIDDKNTMATVPVMALNSKALAYAVYDAEHIPEPVPTEFYNGYIVTDHLQVKVFDPVNNWGQFCEFMGRHHQLSTMNIEPSADKRVVTSILQAYVVEMFGSEVEVPLHLL